MNEKEIRLTSGWIALPVMILCLVAMVAGFIANAALSHGAMLGIVGVALGSAALGWLVSLAGFIVVNLNAGFARNPMLKNGKMASNFREWSYQQPF